MSTPHLYTLYRNVGLDTTITKMREEIRSGIKMPLMRILAAKVTKKCNGRDFDAIAHAVYDYLTRRVKYYRDPATVEWVQGAEYTLATRMGDCDDFTVAGCTLMGTIGITTRIIVAKVKEPRWNHVFCEYFSPKKKRWIPFDACVKQYVGWQSPNILEIQTHAI